MSILLCIFVLLNLCASDEKETVWKISPWIIISGVLSARLYHVISDFELYKNNLAAVFYISNGGLGIWGAVFGGILGAFIALKKYHLSIRRWLNMLAVAVPLGQAVGRWGNYFNHELFGTRTNLPWGTIIDGQKVHPVFLYESLLDLLNFLILFFLYKKSGLKDRGYFFTALFLLNYSVIRFFMEFLRVKHWVIGGLNLSLAIPILVFTASLVYLIVLFIKRRKLL